MLICPISLCRYLLGRREQAAVGCRPDQLPSSARLEPFQFTFPVMLPQTELLLVHSSPAGGTGRSQLESQWPRATRITSNLEDELAASEPGGSRGDNTRRGTLLLLLLGKITWEVPVVASNPLPKGAQVSLCKELILNQIKTWDFSEPMPVMVKVLFCFFFVFL